jgi:hypothetical protein
MNRAAWVFVLGCLAFVVAFAGYDIAMHGMYGYVGTITYGVRKAGAPLAFLIGHASGGLVWGLAVHFYFYKW